MSEYPEEQDREARRLSDITDRLMGPVVVVDLEKEARKAAREEIQKERERTR